jgi:hypothetical protein
MRGGDPLKTITIRGLEPILIDKMKEFAKQQNQSLNQFVVETLKLHMGMEKEKKFTAEYHDFWAIFSEGGLKKNLIGFREELIRNVRSIRNSGDEKPPD